MGFENTGYAKELFQRQIPATIRALERIASALEKIAENNQDNIDILNGINAENKDSEF